MAKNRRGALASLFLLASAAWAQPGGMGAGMVGHGSMWGCGVAGESMGPGMMWGGGPGNGVGYGAIANLSGEQRAKLADAEKQFRQKQWPLMQAMHELAFERGAPYRDGRFDEAGARKQYEAMTALRKQMFDNYIDQQKRVDAILTAQQREQMRRLWAGRAQ